MISTDEVHNATPVEFMILLQFIFANWHNRNIVSRGWEGLELDSWPNN